MLCGHHFVLHSFVDHAKGGKSILHRCDSFLQFLPARVRGVALVSQALASLANTMQSRSLPIRQQVLRAEALDPVVQVLLRVESLAGVRQVAARKVAFPYDKSEALIGK